MSDYTTGDYKCVPLPMSDYKCLIMSGSDYKCLPVPTSDYKCLLVTRLVTSSVITCKHTIDTCGGEMRYAGYSKVVHLS